MQHDHIDYAVRDGVAWITINRPEKRNALTTTAYGQIKQAFRHASYDDDVDIIVVTGTGRDFSVGGDLDESVGIFETRDQSRFHVFEDNLPFETIRSCSKTTIAMVNGLCLGGAISLMACMDLAVASQEAKFSLPEARSGAFEAWGPEFLAPRISRVHINYLVYTGQMISAETALQWGMLNSVVAHDELESAVNELVSQVRRTTAAARAGFKQYISARDQITPLTHAAIDARPSASPLSWTKG